MLTNEQQQEVLTLLDHHPELTYTTAAALLTSKWGQPVSPDALLTLDLGVTLGKTLGLKNGRFEL